MAKIFFKKETKNLILYQVGYISNLRIIVSIDFRVFKVFSIYISRIYSTERKKNWKTILNIMCSLNIN